MKRLGGIVLMGAVLASLLVWGAGCSDDESGAEGRRYYEREVGKNPVKAPADYLYTVTVSSPRHAKEVVALATLRQEIQKFWAMKEHYPVDLQELEEWRGAKLPVLPRGLGYDYNPETGELNAVEVPLDDD